MILYIHTYMEYIVRGKIFANLVNILHFANFYPPNILFFIISCSYIRVHAARSPIHDPSKNFPRMVYYEMVTTRGN